MARRKKPMSTFKLAVLGTIGVAAIYLGKEYTTHQDRYEAGKYAAALTYAEHIHDITFGILLKDRIYCCKFLRISTEGISKVQKDSDGSTYVLEAYEQLLNNSKLSYKEALDLYNINETLVDFSKVYKTDAQAANEVLDMFSNHIEHHRGQKRIVLKSVEDYFSLLNNQEIVMNAIRAYAQDHRSTKPSEIFDKFHESRGTAYLASGEPRYSYAPSTYSLVTGNIAQQTYEILERAPLTKTQRTELESLLTKSESYYQNFSNSLSDSARQALETEKTLNLLKDLQQ